MIVQGFSNMISAYGNGFKPSLQRQASPEPAANLADKVSISDAAKAMMNSSPSTAQDTEIQKRLDAIKAKPNVERTQAEFDYLLANDKRYAEILEKIKAYGMNGTDALSADEMDYLQKASGMVNTMAELSPREKALYDELVTQGNHEAAHGLLLVGMSRIGMNGQQVTLPNGKTFDPTTTEVTAANIRNLFKHLFVDQSGNIDRQFEALASCLDKREASGQAANKA